MSQSVGLSDMPLSLFVAIVCRGLHIVSILGFRVCGRGSRVESRHVNLLEAISYTRNVIFHTWKIIAIGWSRLLAGSDAMREDEMDGTKVGQVSMPVIVSPARYVLLPLAQSVTGYTVKAMERKIERGDWQEGKVWRRAPDGHIMIDLQGYHRWVENQ
jgi:hypothetical protein